MNKYLLKYQRDINEIVNFDVHSDPGDDILLAFDYMLSEIDLTKNGYTISSCRDIMNLKLLKNEVVNKTFWRKNLFHIPIGPKTVTNVLYEKYT